MSESCVYLKIYDPSATPGLATVNRREILRYAGIRGGEKKDRNAAEDEDLQTADPQALMEECISEALPLLTYRVSYRLDEIRWENEAGDQKGSPILPFSIHGSRNAAGNLAGCSHAVMFAATLGIGIDRLIEKYNRISPSKALFMQAIGAERIEALCDTFNSEVISGVIFPELAGEKEKICAHPRFSPGYGDLSLDVQKEFFSLLDCQRRLGLTLNESLLMSPSKSVTAFIGIETTGQKQNAGGERADTKCGCCSKTDCEFRDI